MKSARKKLSPVSIEMCLQILQRESSGPSARFKTNYFRKRNTHWIFIVTSLFVFTADLNAQNLKEHWVDSVYSAMNIDQKIGQLFMVRVSPYQDNETLAEFERKIEKGGLGGILFSHGNMKRQVALTNRFQSNSKTPLIIGIDNHANQGWALDSLNTFPSPIIQSAMENDSLIFFMAKQIAREMKARGIQLHFLDVNGSGDLSYGEDRLLATQKTMLFWKGLQAENVLATAKYFPIQSVKVLGVHKGFPSIELTADSAHTYAFDALFKEGLPVVMPASSNLPLFYEKKKTVLKNRFSSGVLSAAFAGNWIRQHRAFDGLVVVDAETIVNTSKKAGNGAAELFAFQTGNDMIISSQKDVQAATRKIKRLIKKEKQFTAQVNNSVRKILALKYDAGLVNKPHVDVKVLPQTITPEVRRLQQRAYRSAVTVAQNQRDLLPVRALEDTRFSVLLADDTVQRGTFAKFINKYTGAPIRIIDDKKEIPAFADSLKVAQVIIAAIFPTTGETILQSLLNLARDADSTKHLVIADFGCLPFRKYAHEFPVVITGYSDDEEMLRLVPQIIFGGREAKGILPVSLGNLRPGTSVKTSTLNRLNFSFPEEVGIDSESLNKIEAIANEAIANKATPGCHVLIAKEGKIVYERSFGHLAYDKQVPVTDETIYDLASVTKVSATLQAVMFMYEKGLIDINKKASVYLPELKNSNKKDFTLKDILTHQAGLWPFLPFWAQTMKDSLHMPEFYNTASSPDYPYVVADKLYASSSMRDSLWTWIINAKIREKPARTPFDYRYSDMGFYILQHLAETILNQPLQDFLQQNFYEPLGATTLGYLPLSRFPTQRIAPTEEDKLFRKSLLVGMVHDQGAAMHGGIAGHAGLFGTAIDLAKLGQMLLQEGNYGGYQYYKPETVRLFTQKQFVNSRRGLGWDKPVLGDWNSPTSLYASGKTFGHTGFTGTCIWIDPEFNLVYIFLSNRVHPDMTNNKLLNANIRSRIQDAIYQSIFNYCKTAGPDVEMLESSPLEASGKSTQ